MELTGVAVPALGWNRSPNHLFPCQRVEHGFRPPGFQEWQHLFKNTHKAYEDACLDRS